MKLTAKNSKGFTLVEIMIVVAIIGILIAIAVPGFVKARTQSRAKACQENLTKIDGAKEQWALENNKPANATPGENDLYGANSYIKKKPSCPGGGNYTIGACDTAPICSIGDPHALSAIN